MRGLLQQSRRGSTMIEATMVLPLLILSVITCVLICMFFYDTTITQCKLHQALRCEAGRVTGQTTNLNPPHYDAGKLSLTESPLDIIRTVTGKEHTDMIHQGILRNRVSANMESTWYAADGVKYVRYRVIKKTPRQSK